MDESNVAFKGTVNGLTIIMKEEEPFEEIIEQINEKVQTASKFFDGAVLNVKYKGKELTKDQEEEIFGVLTKKSGAKITSFNKDLNEPKPSELEKDNSFVQKMQMKKVFFKGIQEGDTKFHRGTVRSGQLLNYNGNIVVLGDVNPGAEIISTGNVVVMGSLRGIVHAGADGNKESVIAALNLAPTQLRIADMIARAPDGDSARNGFIPELACIKDDQVFIERYLPQK